MQQQRRTQAVQVVGISPAADAQPLAIELDRGAGMAQCKRKEFLVGRRLKTGFEVFMDRVYVALLLDPGMPRLLLDQGKGIPWQSQQSFEVFVIPNSSVHPHHLRKISWELTPGSEFKRRERRVRPKCSSVGFLLYPVYAKKANPLLHDVCTNSALCLRAFGCTLV